MNMICGRSSSVEHQLPKLDRRVQFPSPAFGIIFFILGLVFIAGCATVEIPSVKPKGAGFYYRVVRFDTLHRIAKTYGVDLEILATVNNISDTSKLEVGQRLFIPGEFKKELVSNQPSETPDYSPAKDSFAWPVKGKVISYFNQRFNNVLNKGLIIRSGPNEDVVACFDGVVGFKGELPKGQGSTIIIEHNDRILTVYSNLSQVFINVGDKISKGQILGKAGLSPCDNTSYLHFEVRDGSVARNPLYYLP